MKKIMILGLYGGLNFGDEIILENMLSLHREVLSEAIVTVASPRLGYVEKRFPVRTFQWAWGWRNAKAFYDEMKEHDVLIIGGGGLLQDYGHSPPRAILAVMRKVLAAALLRKPVMFYSLGVAPIETRTGKLWTGLASNFVRLITVRDPESRDALHRLGVVPKSRIHLLPDPAFATQGIRRSASAGGGKTLGISILPFFQLAHNEPDKDRRAREILTDVCNHLIEEKGYSIVFFPCNDKADSEESLSIIEGIGNRSQVDLVRWKAGTRVSYRFFEQIDFLLSMRLHPQILASLLGIPFVSIVYHRKIGSLLRMLDYDGLSCDLTSISTERILLLLDTVATNKDEISEKLLRKSQQVSEDLARKRRFVDGFLRDPLASIDWPR